MSIGVDFKYIVCKWCGCPFGYPEALNRTPRCPNGHLPWTSTTPDEVERERDELRAQVLKLNRKVRRLQRECAK